MLKPLIEINFGSVPIYFIMMLLGFAFGYMKLDGILKQKGYSVYMAKIVLWVHFYH